MQTSDLVANHKETKISVVGFDYVGKTQLILRFIHNKFKKETPQGQNYHKKTLTVDNKTMTIGLQDSQYDEEDLTVLTPFLNQAEGLVLVYSVDDQKSFAQIKKIKRFVDQQKESPTLPIVLVGNKCDLDNRVISYEEGEDLANNLGISFLEISALTGMNCEEVFKTLIREIQKGKSNPLANEKVDVCKGCGIF